MNPREDSPFDVREAEAREAAARASNAWRLPERSGAGSAAIASAVLAGPHGVRSCCQSVGRQSDGFTAGGFAGGRGGGERGGVATALQQGQPWRGVGWTPPREAQARAPPTDSLR